MATPSRPGFRGGYYADVSSPIASTPQRKATPGAIKVAPATPSLATLSPMRAPGATVLQRADADDKPIFSPAFKFAGGDDGTGGGGGSGGTPTAAGAAAMPTASAMGGAGVPTLAAAPAARKVGASATVGGYATSATVAAASVMVSGGAGRTTSAHLAAAASVSTTMLAQRTAVSLSLGGGTDDSASTAASGASYGGTPAAAGVRTFVSPASTAALATTPPSSSGGGAVGFTAAGAGGSGSTVASTVAAIPPAPADEAEGEAEEDQYDYDYEEFNPYLFIKMLPAYHTVAPRVPRIVLPKKKAAAPPVSLVLDLDETLVHCSVDPIVDADLTFGVTFNGCNYQVYVRKRPHLDKFLQWIAGRFEVIIFTASQQVYAERLLDLLDPDHKYINHRLYRDSCLNVDGNYLKDLNVLGRDLTKAVLVDNSPHAFGYQLDNGIPIESWFDDRSDTELLKLTRFLETIVAAPDVRPYVREKFKVHKLVADAR